MSSLHPCQWQCGLFLALLACCSPVVLFPGLVAFYPARIQTSPNAQMSLCSPLLPLSCAAHLGWVSFDFCLLRLAEHCTLFGFLLPEPLSGSCIQAGAGQSQDSPLLIPLSAVTVLAASCPVSEVVLCILCRFLIVGVEVNPGPAASPPLSAGVLRYFKIRLGHHLSPLG